MIPRPTKRRVLLFVVVIVALVAVHASGGFYLGEAHAQSTDPAPIDNLSFDGIVKIFVTIACILFRLTGIFMIGVGIWGSIKYMTAGSDSSKAGDARKYLTWFVIGAIVVVLAGPFFNLIVDFTSKTLGGETPDLNISCLF